jgi:hypothetical protein
MELVHAGFCELTSDRLVTKQPLRWKVFVTPGVLGWTAGRLQMFRNDHHLRAYRHGERIARGELMLDEVAAEVGVSKMTVIRMKSTRCSAPFILILNAMCHSTLRPTGDLRHVVSGDTVAPEWPGELEPLCCRLAFYGTTAGVLRDFPLTRPVDRASL